MTLKYMCIVAKQYKILFENFKATAFKKILPSLCLLYFVLVHIKTLSQIDVFLASFFSNFGFGLNMLAFHMQQHMPTVLTTTSPRAFPPRMCPRTIFQGCPMIPKSKTTKKTTGKISKSIEKQWCAIVNIGSKP